MEVLDIAAGHGRYVLDSLAEGEDRALGDLSRAEEEMGDLLFAIANLSRKLGIEPESALRRAVQGFARRFEAMERMARADGLELESLSPDRWGEYWERAKSEDEGRP